MLVMFLFMTRFIGDMAGVTGAAGVVGAGVTMVVLSRLMLGILIVCWNVRARRRNTKNNDLFMLCKNNIIKTIYNKLFYFFNWKSYKINM